MTGKHTSVTKEASRAIKDLKNKRKAHEQRVVQRVRLYLSSMSRQSEPQAN